MFKQQLSMCMEGKTLTEQEAEQLMNEIMTGQATASQIASLLTVLRFRGETVDEMAGFAKAMRQHSITIPHQLEGVVDTCGTGGDDLSTFNISTTTAIVLSAMGVKVAKHGNRAVSSKSGSADVLEKLGIEIQSTPEEAVNVLKEKNLCFLFAPLYHQSMKHAVVPRKEIGFRTVFNLLGPLTNPARAKHQLIGVYHADFAKKMAETLARLGTAHTLFVTGGEGLDECSITAPTSVVEVKGQEILSYTLTPEDVGLNYGKLEEIQVDTPEESAALIRLVLQGKANISAESIVVLNAGAALYAADKVDSIKAGVMAVKEAISSGKVYEHFLSLQNQGESTNA
ncbi:anthranilate phosphoribosyltransferase [Halalkalibacter urbisdiaboli]|uniref:anthranilate phosphoribosyltransferase n=1 Tax=Halalkalibacter urbisdiaboli TaxID=1960589 RepID=UPI000B42DFF6|nr:anthranilate phosphoribosyltransferase [Halalkalibacter urbisdiaboli]